MVFQDTAPPQPQPLDPSLIKKLILVASIAAPVQYGWALQLSLLTPFTQLLGLSHKWTSFVWLCGPISGLIVQPIAGHFSDHCTSRFGRRRPFIVAGAILLSLGVLLIGFAADIGRAIGDSLAHGMKPRAVAMFVIGFWLLDISNNLIQGPCRALLADISEDNDAMVTIGNALFSFFMAVGNIIGYAAGSYYKLYNIMPFTKTEACDVYCANLKTCFLLAILFTTCTIMLVVYFIKEEQLDPSWLEYEEESSFYDEKPPPFYKQIAIAVRSQSGPIRILYIVTALNWIGFFPFLLYDTDWMGKEVYGGNVGGSAEELMLYDHGVRAGASGLMLYVMTMGTVSLFMEQLIRYFGSLRRVWGIGNFILAFCMGLTVLITKMANSAREAAVMTQGTSLVPPPSGVTISSFLLFAILGLPQAVTYSIPFALASIYSKDTSTGQGLALGVLNLAIVIPQMGVALVSGPFDSLFGGSNLPAFLLGGAAAVIGGIAAIKLLPDDDE
ncbi:hypothetical protein RD792_011066 [Penstemon davidsonii]|uniref:Sucrose transporter n=1 Tax=Penstemon davidsonii TaxID=160366 RepID=A0ABR0D3R8_9LAMI|nr:hypothetical protein RD792_011066 [Penstemon davidsonii]